MYSTIFKPFNIKQHISIYISILNLSPFKKQSTSNSKLSPYSFAVVQRVHDFLVGEKGEKSHRIPIGICLPPRSAAAPGATCRTWTWTWTWTWHYLGALDVRGAPGKRVSGLVEIHGFPKMICISGGVLWAFYSLTSTFTGTELCLTCFNFQTGTDLSMLEIV